MELNEEKKQRRNKSMESRSGLVLALCYELTALHTLASSAPQARLVEEQVTQLTMGADTNPTPSAPRVINVDKNVAYPEAITQLKVAGILLAAVELRQVKYLNNLIEQDHRFIKRRIKPELGFFSFETVWRTLQEYEVMHMLRKWQMRGVEKGNMLGQVAFIARLFGLTA
jgi:IS6 family transposase